jgi:hypothetical protein
MHGLRTIPFVVAQGSGIGCDDETDTNDARGRVPLLTGYPVAKIYGGKNRGLARAYLEHGKQATVSEHSGRSVTRALRRFPQVALNAFSKVVVKNFIGLQERSASYREKNRLQASGYAAGAVHVQNLWGGMHIQTVLPGAVTGIA